MKKIAVPLFQSGVLAITLVILLLAMFWLPSTAAFFAADAPEYAYLQYPLLIGIQLTLLPFLLGIYDALLLSRMAQKGEALSHDAAGRLRRIRSCAFLIALLYAAGFLVLLQLVDMSPGIALLGLLIFFASMMIALVAGILLELLLEALAIKEEHDLTV